MPNTSQLEIFGPRDGHHDHFTAGPVPEFLVDNIEDAIRELRDAGVEVLGEPHVEWGWVGPIPRPGRLRVRATNGRQYRR